MFRQFREYNSLKAVVTILQIGTISYKYASLMACIVIGFICHHGQLEIFGTAGPRDVKLDNASFFRRVHRRPETC